MTENRRATQAVILARQLDRERQIDEYRRAIQAETMKQSQVKYLEHYHIVNSPMSASVWKSFFIIIRRLLYCQVSMMEIFLTVVLSAISLFVLAFGGADYIVKIVSGWLN